MRVVTVLAAALVLAACSPKVETPASDKPPMRVDHSVDVPAGAEATLDPAELDLSEIALAMRIPSTFSAYEEGAELQVSVVSPRLGVDIAETFPLVGHDGYDSAFLASEAREGFSFWTYATRREDAERLDALSRELVRLKTEAPGENELSFSAIAPGCWNEAAQTPGSLSRTLYIRLKPEMDFQVLVPEQVLAEGDVAGTGSYWGACGE